MTSSDMVPVVSAGVASAAVVVADESLGSAADLLVEYVRRSTGVALPRIDRDQGSDRYRAGGRIVLATSAGDAAVSCREVFDGLDEDSFAFEPSQGDLVLAGRTALAVEFAVLEFLERYVGVRWLMPGDDGEDVPEQRTIAVPLRSVRCRPASRSRTMMGMMSPSGLGGASGHAWGRRNRLRGGVEFGHALWQILPPSSHAGHHPQWYPPGADLRQRYGWQPRFSDPSTVAAAVDAVVAHCQTNPGVTSTSLAVNDYSGFHPDDVTAGRRNSAGFPDASDAYFGWVNRVTEGVLDQVPGIRVGVLAYHDVLDPPGFPLHPAVVPFITGDRIAWSDPQLGDRGRRHTAAWAQRAQELGWWEYLHGASYLVPKVQLGQHAANLRFAADHNVVHHFAETWPDWGGGPQAWVTCRLMWDPSLDPYELLAEWCTRAAGQPGGDQLVAHFRDWERFWHDDVPASPWFSAWRSAAPRSDYLRFDDPGYLDVVDPARIQLGRDRLDRAADTVHTSRQASRVAHLERRWHYGERAITHRRDIVHSPPPVPADDDEATDLLSTMAARFRTGAELSTAWRQLAPADAAKRAAHLPTPLDRVGLSPTFGPGSLSALLAWFAHGDRRRSRCRGLLEELASDPMALLRDHAALVRRVVDGAPNVFENPGLESGLAHWEVSEPGSGTIDHGTAGARSGRGCLRIDGADHGGISQTVAMLPGRYGVVAHFWCPADTERGTLRVVAQLPAPSAPEHDATRARGHVETTLRSPWTSITRAAGSWDTLAWAFTVPASGSGTMPTDGAIATRLTLELTTVVEGPSFPSMGPDDCLIIDDLQLHRLDAEPRPDSTPRPRKG